MGRINGIDPIIINTIKTPTQKPAVTETRQTKVSQRKKDEEKQEKNSRHISPYSLPDLTAAVDRLNQLLAEHKIPLYFQIVTDNPQPGVILVAADNKNVIAELKPARVFELLNRFNTRGFTVDELI
ncbi:MAG: hypothetical protein GXY49_04965 [Syntrophomonadaceae bacterium]|nr:hypothetical protein [Syntrophomonadaceae bacterium]